MLNNTKQEYSEIDFLNTLEDLDKTVKKAQLIHKIELKSQESEKATPKEIKQIQLELKAYREQIRLLD